MQLRLQDLLTRKDASAEAKLKKLTRKRKQYGQSAKSDLRMISYTFKTVTGERITNFVPKPPGTDPRPIHERDMMTVGGDMGGSMKVRLSFLVMKPKSIGCALFDQQTCVFCNLVSTN